MAIMHTPGPWETIESIIENDHCPWVVVRQKGFGGSSVARLGRAPFVNMADAHLIESAPDMVSMLEGIIEQLSRFDYKSKRNDIWNSSLVDNALQLAKHGLAKARGEV